jgi:hypothetical protein
MKTLKFIEWLNKFIEDKDNLVESEVIELKSKLYNIKNMRTYTFDIVEGNDTSFWKSNVTFPTPLFKNPYNYEISKVDNKHNKK